MDTQQNNNSIDPRLAWLTDPNNTDAVKALLRKAALVPGDQIAERMVDDRGKITRNGLEKQ